MSSFSSLFVASLAGVAAAYPGMGGPIRRDPGLLGTVGGVVSAVTTIVSGTTTTTSSASASSSTYPAWHPPQSGEGEFYFHDLITTSP